MAQKIVTLCDAHAHYTDDEVGGSTWVVSLTEPGAKPTEWEVDLCAEHAAALSELAAMLGTVGRVTSGRRGRPRTVAPTTARTAANEPETDPVGAMIPDRCPECGHMSPNRTSLTSHVRSQHNTTLARLEGRPEPYGCPADGCDFRTARRQGLGAHLRSAHPGLAVAS